MDAIYELEHENLTYETNLHTIDNCIKLIGTRFQGAVGYKVGQRGWLSAKRQLMFHSSIDYVY